MGVTISISQTKKLTPREFDTFLTVSQLVRGRLEDQAPVRMMTQTASLATINHIVYLKNKESMKLNEIKGETG